MPQSNSFALRNATWIFPPSAAPGNKAPTSHASPLAWAHEHAMALAAKLTGQRPHTANSPANPGSGSPSILVGTPESNPGIKKAIGDLPELALPSDLGPDDYIIRSLPASISGGKSTSGGGVASGGVVITGKTNRAAMYGLFAFFEALGCRFLLSGDVLPPANPDLQVPTLNLVGRTACTWRGAWISFCFVGTSIMSLPDFQRLFDQLAKMRFNRVIYYHFENEPFIDFSFKGERKLIGDTTYPESGFMSLGRGDTGSYRVSDMAVGREMFHGREFVAPLEFQNAKTSAQALDTGRQFMTTLITAAKERGLGTWTSFDPAFIPLNLAKYTRLMPRPVELYGGFVSFTDPAAKEINAARIKGIVETYPDLEGLLLQITEGFYEDKHADSQAVIAREWPKYREARALLKEHWGKWWEGDERQDFCIRSDIGFAELAKDCLAAAREAKPGLGLGLLCVCKAYLLTHLHKVLPKDVAFVDIEAQSLWTVDGAPLHLFKQMQGRECALVPRAYDDGSLAGLQFNLNLYQRDGFLASQKENGTSGLVVQISHTAGNDHNVGFLAQGMWDDRLTPEAFYKDFATALFGSTAGAANTTSGTASGACPQAQSAVSGVAQASGVRQDTADCAVRTAPPAVPLAAAIEAFNILEENELFLGGRGAKNMPYSLKPPEIGMLRAFKAHTRPFQQPAIDQAAVDALTQRAATLRQGIANLERAAACFERVRGHCAPGTPAGKSELEYFIGKTSAYVCHLQTLVMLRDVYAAYVQAFADLAHGPVAPRRGLQAAVTLAQGAEANAIMATNAFAACVRQPSDLAVVWMMNQMIIGTRILRQYLANVSAYYEGKDYWGKVDWELFSGSSPNPTYSVDELDTLVLG